MSSQCFFSLILIHWDILRLCNLPMFRQLFLHSSSWLSSHVTQIDLFSIIQRSTLFSHMVRDMFGLLVHVTGRGCPGAKTSVWDHVLWAWGSEAEDTSADDLVAAVPASGSHWQKKYFRLSPCFRNEQGAIISAWAGNAGTKCRTLMLCMEPPKERSHVLHKMSFYPLPSWHLFFSLTGTDWYSAMTQFHSSSHHRGKEPLLLWFYVRNFLTFLFIDHRLGKVWQLVMKITFPIHAVLLMFAESLYCNAQSNLV